MKHPAQVPRPWRIDADNRQRSRVFRYSRSARVGNCPTWIPAAAAGVEHPGNLMRMPPRDGAQVETSRELKCITTR